MNLSHQIGKILVGFQKSKESIVKSYMKQEKYLITYLFKKESQIPSEAHNYIKRRI